MLNQAKGKRASLPPPPPHDDRKFTSFPGLFFSHSKPWLKTAFLPLTIPVVILFTPYAVVARGVDPSQQSLPVTTSQSGSTSTDKSTASPDSSNLSSSPPPSTNPSESKPTDELKSKTLPQPKPDEKPKTDDQKTKDDSKKDDSKTKLDQFLGAMKPILAEATKVEAYLVEPEINPTISEDSKLGGFPVKKGPVNLTAEQMKALKTLVLDEKSYFWGAVKKCIIRPEVALRFLKGNEEVSILFSPYCKVWTFVHQKKQANQDYALVKKSVEDLLNSLFPPTQQ